MDATRRVLGQMEDLPFGRLAGATTDARFARATALAANDRADLIIHLIRNTFRLASKRDWDALRRVVKPIYTAVNAAAAREAFDQLAESCGQRYPAIVRLWDNAWAEINPVPRDPPRGVDQRDLSRCMPVPTDDQSPRALPVRTSDAVPLPRHPIPGPDRTRVGTMSNAVETSAQRVREHLRRPVPGSPNLPMETAGNVVR